MPFFVQRWAGNHNPIGAAASDPILWFGNRFGPREEPAKRGPKPVNHPHQRGPMGVPLPRLHQRDIPFCHPRSVPQSLQRPIARLPQTAQVLAQIFRLMNDMAWHCLTSGLCLEDEGVGDREGKPAAQSLWPNRYRSFLHRYLTRSGLKRITRRPGGKFSNRGRA